jgi:16S rRNA pseudouridine516 synthase
MSSAIKSAKTQRASLEQILFSQGFGTRKLCRVLVYQGKVEVAGALCEDPEAEFDLGTPDAPLEFSVRGERWQYHSQAYLMLNKPPGYECSQKTKSHLSVYELLPLPLRERGKGGVQAVGRLDQDTTGLLIFSDDGQFIHRMTSPKHEVPKVYDIMTSDAIAPAQIAKLLAGVVLADDPEPVRAQACVPHADKRMSMTLTSGKYHQVKRMLAVVGNHVEALHRSRIGRLSLPDDLAQGQWRWLTPADLVAASDANAAPAS